jgi:cytochrome P450
MESLSLEVYVSRQVTSYSSRGILRYTDDDIQVSVSVPHYSTFRSHKNFVEPDSFLPERWLEGNEKDSRFACDRREALQPFSFGPRACIGRK